MLLLLPLISKVLLLPLLAATAMTKANTVSVTAPFTLSAAPGTDIWRKPPSHDAFNAPTFPSLSSPSSPSRIQLPLEDFQRAKITFTLPPGKELRQYDQAGLLLHFTKPGLSQNETKWLKTGVEWYQGRPYVSTVSTDAYSDWSIVPIPTSELYTSSNDEPSPGVTIEAKRERDALGKSAWVYWVVRDGEGTEVERRPVREVNWVFALDAPEDSEGGEAEGVGEGGGWSVGVAGYVARPTVEGGEGLLEAEFAEGLEVEALD